MFTLDSSRKSMIRESISFSHDGFQPIENNGAGIFILRQGQTDKYWMSVPQKKWGVRLYPMKAIITGV